MKDFIPLYRPVRFLHLTVTRGLFNCIIKLELWGVDAQKNEVSVGLVTELRVMGHDRTCARAFKGDADSWNDCTSQPPWGLEINETKLTQLTVVNNMKRSLDFLLHYFVQLLLCRSDFIS